MAAFGRITAARYEPTFNHTGGAVGCCNGLLASLASRPWLCRLLHMATNLAIDGRLLDEALRIGGQRTKKDTVTQALQEYVQRRKRAKILDLFGKVDFAPRYDYKRQRRRS